VYASKLVSFNNGSHPGGLWYYDRTGNEVFAIVGGAVLGVGAGLLWTCAGYIEFSYAGKSKGPYAADIQRRRKRACTLSSNG